MADTNNTTEKKKSPVEEQALSQELSQLSTSKDQAVTDKRKRFDSNTSLTTHILIAEDEEDEDEEIPAYLCDKNKLFEQMIQQIPTESVTSVPIEELRQLAILLYQNSMIDLKKSLWSTYLKAGTGTLKTEHPGGPEIWPTALKSLLKPYYDTADDSYLKFVDIRLRRLDQKQEHYQNLYEEKKRSIDHSITAWEPFIQTYIQQNLRSLHAQYDYTIALVGYDYEDHRLDLDFQGQEPNENHIDLCKRLCHRKYEQEKAKQEVLLLKQYATQKKFPESLNSIQISLPRLIHTINDIQVRQHLLDQHEKIMQDYNNEMMAIFMEIAELHMFETQKLFDNEMAKIWHDDKTVSHKRRLNQIMLNLIQQRLDNITERVQCIYNYKTLRFS